MSFGARNLDKPTADERRRTSRARDFGCIACRMEGRASSRSCGPLEENHLLRGVRAGHRFTVILGAWHHRGIFSLSPGQTTTEGLHGMTLVFGPSLAHGSKPFHDQYGSDQDMLDYQDKLIGWPQVKIERARNAAKSRCTRPEKMLERRY